MAQYPSDFDVLLVSDVLSDKARSALADHPLIKSITPQRKVTRTLKEEEEHEDEDPQEEHEEEEEDDKADPNADPKPCNHPNCPDQVPWTRGKRKLAFGEGKYIRTKSYSPMKLLFLYTQNTYISCNKL